MNRGKWSPDITDRLKGLFFPDHIMHFLSAMRHVDYYSRSRVGVNRVLYYGWLWKFHRLSVKLGFSIGPSVFGYGLVIYHYGTIVVGDNNRIGNYAVMHTSTCIAGKESIVGDGLFMSTGAVIANRVELGDNVTVGANSVVCKSIRQSNILLTGAPAAIKKDSPVWYVQEGGIFLDRARQVESLKASLTL